MKLNTRALSEVESGFPIIADGTYNAKIHKVEVKPNKAGTGNNLKLLLQITDQTVVNYEGKEMQNRNNIFVTRYISLVPTDDYDPDRNLKELATAIGLPADEDLTTEALAGKELRVKVAYKAPEGQYPAGNDIRSFYALRN